MLHRRVPPENPLSLDHLNGYQGKDSARWIVAFVNSDFDGMAPAFVSWWRRSAAFLDGGLRRTEVLADRDDPPGRIRGAPLTPQDVRRAHAEVRYGLARLAKHLSWFLSRAPKLVFVKVSRRRHPPHSGAHNDRGTIARVRYSGDAYEVFLAKAASVVATHWPQLHSCKRRECPHWVFREQKRQYCSDACRLAAFIDQRPDYYADRYARRRRKTAPNLRIPRRPRAPRGAL
jgi:hypothetical protein